MNVWLIGGAAYTAAVLFAGVLCRVATPTNRTERPGASHQPQSPPSVETALVAQSLSPL